MNNERMHRPLGHTRTVSCLAAAAAILASGNATAQSLPAPPPAEPAAAAPPPAAAPAPEPAAAAPPPAPLPQAAAQCVPACRSGFTCLQGQCVSACNPPCAAGQRCTANGECEAEVAPPPPVTNVFVNPGPPPDPGWATGAGVFGIVAGLGTVALAAGAEATKDDQIPSLPLGVAATLLVAVSGPVVGVGGASARRGGDVEGSVGLRIAGWVGYGLTLLDASSLIVLGVAEIEPPDGVILSVGVLGALSLACLSTDAFLSASEASDAAAKQPPATSTEPALGWAFDAAGQRVPTFGVAHAF